MVWWGGLPYDEIHLFFPSVFPKDEKTQSILVFWEECVSDGSSSFYCHPDIFCRMLKNYYTHKVDAKQPGHIEKGTAVLKH